MVEMEMGIFGS